MRQICATRTARLVFVRSGTLLQHKTHDKRTTGRRMCAMSLAHRRTTASRQTTYTASSQIPKAILHNMSYVPFAYGANNHGAVTLPHWQEEKNDASIPASFLDSHGGQRYVPRNMPANFAWAHGKPAQAAHANFGGLVALRAPLQHDNSYYSNAWRWRGSPMYADQIQQAQVCSNAQLRWQYGEQQTRKIK
jgi:hypothetical protein